MASRRRIKTVHDSRRDLISELPTEVKDRILDCLPTRFAARTALLSTHWNNAWLRHGRLVFDHHFFQCLPKCAGDKRPADKRAALVNTINVILLHRVGPVKKFALRIFSSSDPKPLQSDLDQWFLFLSRNGVEELDVSININITGQKYKLPACILLCQTIKELKLDDFRVEIPANAPFMFPSATSLVFKFVDFHRNGNGNGNGILSVPNLEKLAFYHCGGTHSFEISAPKLEGLYGIGLIFGGEWSWFTVHLKSIKTLCLSAVLLEFKDVAVAAAVIPSATNLQVIKLYDLSFGCGKQVNGAMQLLQNSPNLRELEIRAENIVSWRDDKIAASRLVEDLKMLHTTKIESFSGAKLQMPFVKTLLPKSPALHKIVIQESADIDVTVAFKISKRVIALPSSIYKSTTCFHGIQL